MDGQGKPTRPNDAIQALSGSSWLEVRAEVDAHVVSLRGDIPFDEVDLLREHLPRLLDDETPNLFVDLREAEFLGSAVLAAIIAAHNEAQRHGGRVVLVGPRPPIARVLSVTRLDRLIPIYPDLDSARDAVKKD